MYRKKQAIGRSAYHNNSIHPPKSPKSPPLKNFMISHLSIVVVVLCVPLASLSQRATGYVERRINCISHTEISGTKKEEKVKKVKIEDKLEKGHGSYIE